MNCDSCQEPKEMIITLKHKQSLTKMAYEIFVMYNSAKRSLTSME